jgi:hypothetical protein
LVAFKDINENLYRKNTQDNKFHITAISRKVGNYPNGIPVLLEISESKAEVSILKVSG